MRIRDCWFWEILPLIDILLFMVHFRILGSTTVLCHLDSVVERSWQELVDFQFVVHYWCQFHVDSPLIGIIKLFQVIPVLWSLCWWYLLISVVWFSICWMVLVKCWGLKSGFVQQNHIGQCGLVNVQWQWEVWIPQIGRTLYRVSFVVHPAPCNSIAFDPAATVDPIMLMWKPNGVRYAFSKAFISVRWAIRFMVESYCVTQWEERGDPMGKDQTSNWWGCGTLWQIVIFLWWWATSIWHQLTLDHNYLYSVPEGKWWPVSSIWKTAGHEGISRVYAEK